MLSTPMLIRASFTTSPMVKSQLSSKSPHRPLAHVPRPTSRDRTTAAARRELSDRASASDRIADADAEADASRSRSSVALSRRPAVAPRT